MRTSLRKMGNSTGMIVPRSILGAIGATTGAAMDLRVEDGKLIVTPAERVARDGWAEAAAGLAATGEAVTLADLLPRFDPARLPREPWVVG